MQRFLPVLVPLFFLVACSDGLTDSADKPAEHTVPLGGGTVTVDAGQVQLAFPAAAVDRPVTVIVTPAAVGDARVVAGTAYEFEPHGIKFSHPVRLSIRYDRTRLRAGVDATTLRLHTLEGGVWVLLPNGTVDTSTATVSADVTSFSQKAVLPSDFAAAVVQLRAEIDQLKQSPGNAELAIEAMIKLSAVMQASGDPRYAQEGALVLDQAAADVCTEYTRAANAALASTVKNWVQLSAFAYPVLNWFAIGQRLPNFSCSGSPDLVKALDHLLNDFAKYYSAELKKLEEATFTKIRIEFDSVSVLTQTAAALDLPSTRDRLLTTAQVPLANMLRSAAYEVCTQIGIQSYLAALLPYAKRGATPYNEQDLFDDVQMCGTLILWQLLNENGEVVASGTFGGKGPGQATKIANTRGLKKGTLALQGRVQPLLCKQGITIDDRLVVLSKEQVDVRGYSPSRGFYDPRVDIDVPLILSRGGIDPDQPGTHRVEILRISSGCDKLYTPAVDFPYVIGTIELEYPQIEVRVTPGNVRLELGASQTFTAQVKGSTQGVNWTASQGTIKSDGSYTATDPDQTVTITATSKEFPNAKATATVSIPQLVVGVAPASVSLAPGAQRQFMASVSGARNTGVYWAASQGTINANGLYTAPQTPGTYQVMASSVVYPAVTGTAAVTVNAPDAFVLFREARCGAYSEANAKTSAAGATTGSHEQRDPQSEANLQTCGLAQPFTGSASSTASSALVASATSSAQATVTLTINARGDTVTSFNGSASGSVNVSATVTTDTMHSAKNGEAEGRASLQISLAFRPAVDVILEIVASVPTGVCSDAALASASGTGIIRFGDLNNRPPIGPIADCTNAASANRSFNLTRGVDYYFSIEASMAAVARAGYSENSSNPGTGTASTNGSFSFELKFKKR